MNDRQRPRASPGAMTANAHTPPPPQAEASANIATKSIVVPSIVGMKLRPSVSLVRPNGSQDLELVNKASQASNQTDGRRPAKA